MRDAVLRRAACVRAAVLPGDGTSKAELAAGALMSTLRPVMINVAIVVMTAVLLQLDSSKAAAPFVALKRGGGAATLAHTVSVPVEPNWKAPL